MNLINRSFVLTGYRKSYLFHSLNLEACSLHLIEWNRTHIVERWINTDQFLHLDTDQKTIRDNLRRTNFDRWSTLCWVSIDYFFTRDEIRDHISKHFLHLTQIFIFINLLSLLCSSRANWIKRSILLNLVSTKFVSLRSQSISPPPQVVESLQNYFAVRAFYPAYDSASRWILAKLLRSQSILSRIRSRKSLNSYKSASQSEQSRSSHISQVVKLLQWRQILNHSSIDSKKNDES